MRILIVHNYYQQAGGEDTVVANEINLLERRGHEVYTFFKNNGEIDQLGALGKLKLATNMAWSDQSKSEFLQKLEEIKPDVCHAHNTFPLFSPSIFEACKELNVPVVKTLHNYRLICSNGLFLRNGKACEDCLGRSAFGAVLKKCYRDSAIQTAAVARMIEYNKNRNTWNKLVDHFFCFNEFAKTKFIQSGISPDKLIVKPNFIPEAQLRIQPKEDYYLYIGRLDEYKGIRLLARIASRLTKPLFIIGSGELESEINNVENIKYLGQKPHSQTMEYLAKASALLFPSLCYEGMPMTILEAFSLKTPVIASNIGSMSKMITHKENGLLFSPNSDSDLMDMIHLLESDHELHKLISENAIHDFQSIYSEDSVYETLFETYQKVIGK